jgi:hypothetical protein
MSPNHEAVPSTLSILSLWRNHVVCSFTQYSMGHRETTLFERHRHRSASRVRQESNKAETWALQEVIGLGGC